MATRPLTGDEAGLTGSSSSGKAAASESLKDAARARPVEVLRLGTKTHYLHEAGIHTLGDLVADGVIERLPTLPGIGLKTARLARKRLADILDSAAENGGEPDWDTIAVAWGFATTPAEPVSDGKSFLAVMPGVIATVVCAHENAMDRLILSERIGRVHAERMTLEAIGTAFNVSRERVRQRQVRLLDNLANALINDDQSYMPVHFRESFREFWVRAARHFESIAELDYPEFERGLDEVWGLPAGRLSPFMPLAVATLADGIRIPAPSPALHPSLATTPEKVLDRPLHDFPFRQAREGLEASGLTSVGLLLQAARENRLPLGRDGRIAVEILNGIGRALAEGSLRDADAWAAGLGLVAVPQIDPTNGAAFIDALDEALAEAARVNATSGRAEQIYRLRTRMPRCRRPTLQDIAVVLGTHGPTVKREETVLLASLHAQLVEGDMTGAAVVWRPGFISFFRIAAELYALVDGNYCRFCSLLGRQLNSDPAALLERVEGLWAVLSLYPGGRRARLAMNRSTVPARVPEAKPALGGVVILRGFRRPH